MNTELIGSYLRMLRLKAGLSQWELYHLTDKKIARGSIANYETGGAKPPIDVFYILCKAMNGSMGEFESYIKGER